ncbi:SDR family NAD(P)-dependent oxidoreductase [Paraburkholderia metrosideri]|uniref:3-oxoacyl-[acyl-carrier-protein] reductase FabG n=1 Tax=Paraburkholderia metrosideri TaxID=580937 RepID=A0ABN7HXY6_9BURK|nr:SDR family oxidoreductase [Paraburkholderia metrosideri]CAD6540177.1 3-oxoacyl-[acyl-carrier-protein] reductase FabG [Paraburkholderia metrosideri]
MTGMEQLGAARLLRDKVAIVTGSNRGIGHAVIRTFAAHGARVFACMREIGPETLDRLQEIENAHGVSVQALSLDLADERSIKSAIKEIAGGSTRIDVLVNNAGTASGSLFQMTTMAEMRRVFEVNFFGQMLLTQGLARLMARNKSGSIINISSTAAQIADPGTLTYGSSKAAFARATQSMATEFGTSGIRVNAIAPGVTRTDMYDKMAPAAREKLIAASALKRAAEPQDIANVALFLASELSAFVTGQTVRVDGGMV